MVSSIARRGAKRIENLSEKGQIQIQIQCAFTGMLRWIAARLSQQSRVE